MNSESKKFLTICVGTLGGAILTRFLLNTFLTKAKQDQTQQYVLSNQTNTNNNANTNANTNASVSSLNTEQIPIDTKDKSVIQSPKNQTTKTSDYVSARDQSVLPSANTNTPKQIQKQTVSIGAEKFPLQMIECPIGSYRFETFTNRFTPSYQAPTKQVSISVPFLLSAHEIPQGLYTLIMETNPSRNPKGVNYPVENISWYDALMFCNRLSTKLNLTPCYTITNVQTKDTERDDVTKAIPYIQSADVVWNKNANGFRLPTEEEWQYASIADSKSAYIGSDLVDESCWYKSNSSNSTQPIGGRKPNAWGFYDMGGNVSEFCWNSVDAQNPNLSKGNHIIKGGAFDDPKEKLLSSPSFRDGGFRSGNIGFRIAKNK